MEIVNLDSCPESGLFYGGRAGQKVGILIDGEPWIAKYTRSTRDLAGKHLPAYTSSPLSEYLGSHIYALLGIDAHETLLGYRRGKIVCACKDFTHPDKRLFEFKDIKNSLSDDDPGDFTNVPSDGESVFLSDVLATLSLSEVLRSTPGVRERFWDMFVVDAFLKNPDRNNGNWGLLRSADGSWRLAPVYDLGSALFSKRSDSLAVARAEYAASLEEDAFGTNVSCYRMIGEDGTSHAIHPFEFMARSRDPELAVARTRVLEAVDMSEVDALIDDVPTEAFGCTVLTDERREAHKKLLRYRLENGFG
ncbi:MAG: HipA domain-containing protein [Eggerthellaceae bacterium]|nr:HipA domain-containing protein [Eggerthellaceae bacterium]